jgi:hypothetical protein
MYVVASAATPSGVRLPEAGKRRGANGSRPLQKSNIRHLLIQTRLLSSLHCSALLSRPHYLVSHRVQNLKVIYSSSLLFARVPGQQVETTEIQPLPSPYGQSLAIYVSSRQGVPRVGLSRDGDQDLEVVGLLVNFCALGSV